MTEIPPKTIEYPLDPIADLGTLEARRTEDSTTPNASETMGPVAPVHWRGSMLIHLVNIRQLKSQMWSLMPLFLQKFMSSTAAFPAKIDLHIFFVHLTYLPYAVKALF